MTVELAHAPLKYPGLDPWEIWLSEAQERMVLAVPPANLPALQAICERLDVEMTVIGHFTDDHRLRVHYQGSLVADLDMEFLHRGIPTRNLRAIWEEPSVRQEPPERPDDDLSGTLLRILAAPNVASKEAVIRRYDHEVQAATVIKPLAGTLDGPADAAVLRSTYATDRWRGIALGCGVNPRYSSLDPLAMAASAIDEAVRNVVCVGADPDQTAILDNFCWGNPNLPDRLGSLVRAAKGCYEAATAFGTPFISGKDSLNNEYTDGTTGRRISIPPTLLISSIGIVPDVRRAVTMDLKQADNRLYLVGLTRDELGGSHYGLVLGEEWGRAPQPVAQGLETARALHRAILQGLVRACHDCSEGGLAVAASEMCLAGDLGLELDLRAMPLDDGARRTDLALFSESNSRYLVEVAAEDAQAFESLLAGLPFAAIGTISAAPELRALGLEGEVALSVSIDDLHRAWSDQSYARPTIAN